MQITLELTPGTSSQQTMTSSSRKYARDFLSFVNASPTREWGLKMRFRLNLTNKPSLPCYRIRQTAAFEGRI